MLALLAFALLSRASTAQSTDLAARRVTIATSWRRNFWASLAVDGNANTRWQASTGTYPQTLAVDVGPISNVETVSVRFRADAGVTLRYKIQASNINDIPLGDHRLPAMWWDLVDQSSGHIPGQATHTFNVKQPPSPVRYVRVRFLGSSDGKAATLITFRVNGEVASQERNIVPAPVRPTRQVSG